MPTAPHPSHRFTNLMGVYCCAVCYVEPWWPLAKSRCDSSGLRADAALRDKANTNKDPKGEKPIRTRNTQGVPQETILEHLQMGKSLRRIALDLRVDPNRVKALAVANNIPIRKKGSRNFEAST